MTPVNQIKLVLLVGMTILLATESHAQRQMEKLGRGVVAMVQGNGSVYVGWRLLGTDPEDIGFNLYRSANGGAAVQLTTNRIQTTDFVDATANLSQTNAYFVRPVIGSFEGAPSAAFKLRPNTPAVSYISIPLSPDSWDHSDVHVVVGDLDGDGEYEYVVMWSNSSYCDPGQPFNCPDTYKLDAYKLDGTFMWRIDLGWNLMTSPEYTPLVVCDLDGDGKAEVIVKTAEGTTDGTGVTIGDTNGDGKTDYRDLTNFSVPSGPEFLSVFDGATGRELARTNWIPRDLGYGGENRQSRNHSCVAYLDGITPSIVMCRGIYELMNMEAWNFRNGKLTNVWKWSSGTNLDYQEKGSHMIRAGDVNGDGKDDILRGALTLGANGTPLYTKAEGHGDEFRLGDLDPERPGLEVWMGYETPPDPSHGIQLYDAATGGCLWGIPTTGDAGLANAAPLDGTRKGFQCWGWDGIYDIKGNRLTTSQPGTRHEIWWSSSICRQLVDESRVYTWNFNNNSMPNIFDGGDSGYCGAADVLGDWREEIMIVRSTDLRVYSTCFSATNRLFTFMHDPIYRHGVSKQTQRKVPTSTPGFYVGPFMNTPPPPPFSDAALVWRGGNGSNVWDAGITGNWHTNWFWSTNAAICPFTSGATVLFDLSGANNAPVLLSGTLTSAAVKVHSPTDYVFGGNGSLAGTTKLTKAGHGTLTINTINSYSGATLVAEGTLQVNGRLDQSPVTVRGGGPWGPSQLGGSGYLGNGVTVLAAGGLSPGNGTNSPGVLTINNGLALTGGTINNLDLSDDPTGTSKTNDLVNVMGDLTLSGSNSIVINRLNGSLSAGTYPLITYTGTLTGGLTNLSLSGLTGIPCYLTNQLSPSKEIALVVKITRTSTNLTWVGGGANAWDVALSSNWLNGVTRYYFVGGDSVRFDNSGAANPAVNLTEVLPVSGVVVDSSSDYTLSGSGRISGSGGLIKTNTGKLSLLTDNDYTGPTIVGSGTLEVAHLTDLNRPSAIGMAGASPTNLVLYGASTFRFSGTASSTDRGVTLTGGACTIDVPGSSAILSTVGSWVGDGTLCKIGSGTLILSTSTNTYTGGTTISGGTLRIGDDFNLGTGGTLTLSSGGVLEGNPGTLHNHPVVLQTGGGVFSSLGNITITNVISGVGRLTLKGGGQLVLSGANSYSGGTTVSSGSLCQTKPNVLGSGAVTVASGGTLTFRPGGNALTNTLTIAGTGVNGSGALRLESAAATVSGSVTLSADAEIDTDNNGNGSLSLNGPVNLGANTLTCAPGILSPSLYWYVNGSISGTGDLVVSAPLITSGYFRVYLNAANTFSGETRVTAPSGATGGARVIINHPDALQNSTLNLSASGPQVAAFFWAPGTNTYHVGGLKGVDDIAVTNSIDIGGNGQDTTYAGSISGTGGLSKSGLGTLTLSGTNVYTGNTVVSNGTLEVSGLVTNARTLTVQGGAILQLSAGTLSPATVVVVTNGLLTGCGTINSVLVNSGTVQVTCGTLVFNGAVTNNGTILVPMGMTNIFNGPVVNNGIVDASGGGTVIINSTWSGNPYIAVPPGGSYTNTMTGNWSAVTWQPTQPISGIATTNVFANNATINSTNDLGAFELNQLRFAGQAVNLAGQPLVFGGVAPLLTNQQNYACTIANPLTLNQDTAFGVSSNTTTVAGAIDGNFGLIKTGAGKLALAGANTYAGGTTIADGTLSITSDSNLGAAGADVTFTNGGVLQVSTSSITLNNRAIVLQTGGGILTNTSAVTLNSAISGSGRFTKTGSGQLNLSAPNAHSGGTTLKAGTTKIIAASASSIFGTGPVTIASGAQVWDNVGGAYDRTWNNSFTIAGDGGGSAGGGANSGAMFLNSIADITIAGTVTLSANATLGTANSTDIAFILNGNVNLGAYNLTLKGGWGATQSRWAINGDISGSGGLSWTSGSASSKLTLSGSNSFSGTTVISTGSLAIGNVNALRNSTLDTGVAGAQTVSFTALGSQTYDLGGLQGGDNLAIAANTVNVGGNGASTTYSGAVSGTGGIIKSGAGTWTLSGTNTFTGDTIVSNGTLRLTQSLCLAANTSVWLWNTATCDLAFTGTNTVYALYVNGQPKLAGVYGSATLPGKLSGTGYVRSLWPATGYEAWAAQVTNGQTGYKQSATGDGYANLLKYATGSSPTQSDNLARMDGVLTNRQFAFVFHRNTNATDVTLFVEAASGIGSPVAWNGIATNTAGSWGGAANVTESGAGSPVTVTVRDTAAATTNRFFRLRVSRP